MPNLSYRSEHAFESPIRKLTPLANEAKSQGIKVYHLNIGQPDIHSPEQAMRSLKYFEGDLVEYGPSEGQEAYRQKLVEYYEEKDVEITPDDIIVTTGASEALLLTLYSCFDKGDEIIIPEPFYANYNGICDMAGIKIKPIYTSLEDGFPLPTRQQFEAALTPETKGFLLCNPNNPTGKVYDLETLKFLAEMVKEHDLFLIVDEVYREFCYDNQEFHSALKFDDIAPNVVVLDSISKRYSACGVRVGCLITHNKKLRRHILKYAQLRLCPPGIGQHFALATLATEPSYFQSVVAEYDSRRKYVIERLSAHSDIQYNYPEGAFYIFAKLPVYDVDEFCAWLLSDFQYEGATVMLAPGTGFYATKGLGKQEVRIAYVLNKEDLQQALDCLFAGLEKYLTLKQESKAVLL